MKKLSVLLVALAVAVSASAGVSLKANRTIKSNKIVNTKVTKFKAADLKQKADFRVINEQPEGELKSYLRAGDAIYAASGSIYQGEQQANARMDVVFAENNVVYLKNILYQSGQYFGDNWVEGTINEEGTEITVPMGQSIYWSDQYSADVVLAWGSTVIAYNEEGSPYIEFVPDDRTTEVVYTIDGNTITMPEGIAPIEDEANQYWRFEATGLGCYWTDDDSFGGFMEWNTVFTETEPFVAPTVITEIPEGCQTYTYYRNTGYIANSFFGIYNGIGDGKFTVAFDTENGEVYIQNPMWYHDGYNTWVKGTYDWMTGIISIPVGQYLQYYEGSEYGIQLMWGSTELEEAGEDETGEMTYYLNFVVDDRATEIQFMIDDDCIYLLGSNGDVNAEFPESYLATGMMSIYSDDLSALAIEFANAGAPAGQIVNVVPAVPANPTADEWYDCGDESGFSRFYFTLPTTDVDGNMIDPEYLSYIIYTDNDVPFVFDEATYYYDIEGMGDITEVPYWIYSNGYDFHAGYVYFYRTNEGDNPMFEHRIGIQVVYTVNGVANTSDIVYLDVFPDSKVDEINAGKTVANVRYFNVAGQEMAQPEGMTIQVTTYTDGTSSAVKVVK